MIVVIFVFLSLLPQSLKAEEAFVSDCLKQIQNQWPTLVSRELQGQTRHRTECALKIEVTADQLNLDAEGPPLMIRGNLNSVSQLQSCKVDKERIHLVFDRPENREKIQMTLLKKPGVGFSLILSQRKVRAMYPTQMNNLICHLL